MNKSVYNAPAKIKQTLVGSFPELSVKHDVRMWYWTKKVEGVELIIPEEGSVKMPKDVLEIELDRVVLCLTKNRMGEP